MIGLRIEEMICSASGLSADSAGGRLVGSGKVKIWERTGMTRISLALINS